MNDPVLSTLTPLKSEGVGEPVGLGLRRRYHFHHLGKSLSMGAPALFKPKGLIALRLGAKKRSDFIKGPPEMRGGGERFERTHGPIALFDPPMVLL